MTEIWTMGELLAEVMRPERGLPLDRPGPFLGPFPSGAPGIFADTVARLGHSSGIISGVGDDAFGAAIVERLERDGVRTDLVAVVPHRATGVAFVAYAADGTRSFLFHWEGTPAVMAGVPPPGIATGTAYFHVMGCSLMADRAFADRLVETVELFAAGGAQITFDPNIRTELLAGDDVDGIVAPVLARCSILLPGASELASLAGTDDLDRAAGILMGRHPIRMIVLKLGRAGCRVYSEDGRIDVPAYEVDEVDPTGAGDCFDAGFLCGLLDDEAPEDAARLAAAAGALNAAAFGPMEGDISPATVARLRDRG
ncbi:MAG: sugar kinase [Candidatus Limnocylindrales bacterium]